MNIKPFGTNILIQPAAKSEILVSDQGTLCEYGKVIAIGDSVGEHWFWLFKILGIKKNNCVKVGDNLGFLIWGVQKLIVGEQTFYFIPENSDFILGFLEDELTTIKV